MILERLLMILYGIGVKYIYVDLFWKIFKIVLKKVGIENDFNRFRFLVMGVSEVCIDL